MLYLLSYGHHGRVQLKRFDHLLLVRGHRKEQVVRKFPTELGSRQTQYLRGAHGSVCRLGVSRLVGCRHLRAANSLARWGELKMTTLSCTALHCPMRVYS